jgi:hypothetical protein
MMLVPMNGFLLPRSIVQALMLWASVACAAATTHPARAIEAGMPNPPASPTRVKCALLVLDVIDIDDVNESLEVELALLATWHDPRLAFDATEEGIPYKLYQGDFQFAEIYNGWWPQFLIVNQVGRGDTSAISIRVFPDGTVRYAEQRNATLETPMSLHDYPFDTQRLRVLLVPFGDTTEQVLLEVDDEYQNTTEEHVQRDSQVNVAGWDLQDLDMQADETRLAVGSGVRAISRIVTTITFERRSWQLVWQMLFPMLVIVSMIWSIFWIDIESLADRLNVSFIGILTIVAYQFVVMDNMPRMSYLTFTDTLLLVSFVTMSATIPQSLFIHSLVRKGRQRDAMAIDRLCRWVFPIAYTLLVAATFAWYRMT